MNQERLYFFIILIAALAALGLFILFVNKTDISVEMINISMIGITAAAFVLVLFVKRLKRR